MEYTEKEKKSLKFLTDKRDEAYGLMQFEDGEIYQLAEEEFNNYLTIEEIIDKQQKEIEELTYNNEILKKLPNSKEKYIAVLESKLFNSISKDKIKEKIKNLSEEEKKQLKGTKGQDRYSIKQEFMYKRSVLEKLLGDE